MCKMFSVASVGMLTNLKLRLPFGNLTANISEILLSYQNLTEMLDSNQRANASGLIKRLLVL